MAGRIGIVAGRGPMPARVAAACRATGRDYFVLRLDGQADAAAFARDPQATVRLGQGGRALDILREAGVEEVVFAGAVRRPSLAELRPDLKTARFLARIGVGSLGDDGLMSRIVREMEAEGFRVVGADEILGDALASEGRYGSLAPDEVARDDIVRGIEVARALGRADCGQAVVVQQGITLAIEAVEGTDAMIARAATLARAGPGGVLVKVSKPQQERRIDLPTVGLATLRAAAAAGLRGIAVEAGAVLVFERQELIAEADRSGLFVVGVAVDASASVT
jgi:UDP-2,3-diacylglucosamine hydrolase